MPFHGWGTSIVNFAAPMEPVSTFGAAGVVDEVFCVLPFEHATSSASATATARDLGIRCWIATGLRPPPRTRR